MNTAEEVQLERYAKGDLTSHLESNRASSGKMKKEKEIIPEPIKRQIMRDTDGNRCRGSIGQQG